MESDGQGQLRTQRVCFLQSRMAGQSFVNGNVSLSVSGSEGFEKEPVDLTLTEEDLKSLEAGTAMEL